MRTPTTAIVRDDTMEECDRRGGAGELGSAMVEWKGEGIVRCCGNVEIKMKGKIFGDYFVYLFL